MKLKASHHWRVDGTIVIDVRDHDAKMELVRSWRTFQTTRKPQINKLVATMELPRGTSKADVKLAKKSMIMMYEIKMNEVSR
jgi:hypothetical protein